MFVETCYSLCIMAPRNPNKSRRDKPNDSLANQVGGWLGGAAKVVGRAAAQNPLVAQNIRYGKAVAAGPTQLAKTAAIDLAAGAVGAGVGKAAGKVLPKVLRSVLPAEVGVHHSVAMKGQPFTGAIRGSKAGRSLTAMDQQAGQSYFWSTKGKGGAAKAANEVKFQTEEIANKYVDFPDASTAVGYVTRVPRGIAKADPNLLGSIARQVAGGTQKVVKSIPGTGNPYGAVAKSFTSEDVIKLTRAVQQAKAVELAKSSAKIGGAAGVVGGTAAAATKKRGRGGGAKKR